MPSLKSVILELDDIFLDYDTTIKDENLRRQAVEEDIRALSHHTLGLWREHPIVKQAVLHWRGRDQSFILCTRLMAYAGKWYQEPTEWVSIPAVRLSETHSS